MPNFGWFMKGEYMAKNNLPTNGLNEISAEYAHETIKSLNDLYNLGRPENDDDVAQRVDDYFKFCEQSSLRPGVESLALALSVSRTAIWNWEHLEQAMLSNKIYPGSGIFMLKNWANYKDSLDISTDHIENSTVPQMSQEEIQQIAEQAAEIDAKQLLEELPD